MANKTGRGVDARKEQVYKDAYEKEGRLRLKWFRKNEERLIAYSEKPNSRVVPDEIKNKMVSDRQGRYQNVERHPRAHVDDPPPPLVDPDALYNIMKPVDPKIQKLIYQGTQKDGRKNYLHARIRVIPEKKYYFPEVTSFVYGWNMWFSSKTATPVRYGRVQVIKESFYRRNGVKRDPDWYQEPAVLSPTVCTKNC